MTKIEIKQLIVRYPGRKEPTLTGVDLDLHEGETVLLLVASGSGKSTLALTFNGLIPHALGAKMKGQVLVGGTDTQTAETADLSQKVGIVFQDPEAQFVTLKVEDEILFGLENLKQPPETMSAKVDHALAQVGMDGYRQQRVDQLSGGQKQRIALAALLAMQPSTLVFDEPTANLDPVGTADVFALLGEIKAQRQHTLVLVEHKLDSLMHLIDRVVVLGESGLILADGTPRGIFYEHAPLLQEHGIWMPEICLLANELHQTKSLDLAHKPLTLDEMVNYLKDHALPVVGHESGSPLHSPSLQNEQALLEMAHLTFDYGPKRVLNDVSLTVRSGEFLAIVGANGAGKTTLVQHMVGILQPASGMMRLNGVETGQISGRDLAKQVGYVFQNPEHQFITPNVFEEVAYGLRVAGLEEAEVVEKTEQLLKQFGLAKYGKASPFTLSHGEKRRLSVATMLAMGQELLILDEPTFGQDQQNADEIMHLLRNLNRSGKTIIIVTHDMHLVAEYASRAVVMADGRKIFEGIPAELFSQSDILNQARLAPPPISQLASRLISYQSAWLGVHTRAEALSLLNTDKEEA